MTLFPLLFAFACVDKAPAADDSAPVDTTDPGRFSGDYPGGLHFSVDITNMNDHDECDGSVLFVIDMAAETQQLSGEMSCSFSGTLAPFSPMLGSFSGSVSDSGEVQASYETGGGPVQGDITSTIDAAGNLHATLTGSGSSDDLDVTWTGDLNATRE